MSNHIDTTNATPKKGKERRQWKDKFITALGEGLSVTRAARVAGIGREHAYVTRSKDFDFAKAWDNAIEQAIDLAEAELYRRAVTGYEKPVTVAGEREIIKEYSDVLLIFLLKAHKPEVYRERQEITVKDWRSKLIDAIRERKLTYDEIAVELGNDIATELFESAGTAIGQSRKAIEAESIK